MDKKTFHKLIIEEIEKLEASESIDEGLLDRLKAHAAGLKNKLGAMASGAAGKALNTLGASGAAGELEQASKDRKAAAKQDSIKSLMKSHALQIAKSSKSLKDAIDSLNDDLEIIGLNSPSIARELKSLRDESITGITGLITYLNTGGQQNKPESKPVVVTPKASEPVVTREPARSSEPVVTREPTRSTQSKEVVHTNDITPPSERKKRVSSGRPQPRTSPVIHEPDAPMPEDVPARKEPVSEPEAISMPPRGRRASARANR